MAEKRATRRWFAPEVVQTSAMDCGPASLKSLLEGFGVTVSYGRLREACQTDVDGTSIDVLEEVANRLGLEAEQILVPLDHVFLPETKALPAIVVWRNPDGAPHFVILWRTLGRRAQVMDPGMGRRWMSQDDLLANAYVHTMSVPAEAWREFAGSGEFARALGRRLADIGSERGAAPMVTAAQEDPTWRSLATLDAAVRLVAALVRAGGVDRGRSATTLVASLVEAALKDPAAIPAVYWSAAEAPAAEDGSEQVRVTGAVMVRVAGTREVTADEPPLPPELQAALREPPAQPIRKILGMLREDGLFTPASLVLAIVTAAVGGAVEALLLRGLLDVGRRLGVVEQQVGALGALFALLVAMIALELPSTSAMLRIGRRLETRMRVEFLAKIPRLADRYFHSRPTSDMAHRCHSIHPVRTLPSIAARLLRSATDLLVACAGLVWLDPHGLPLVALVAALSIALPWGAQRVLAERDLRVRSYDGGLTRFFLDALLGLFAIRTHGAERPLRSEHGAMLGEWVRANYDRLRASVFVEGVEQIVGSGLAVWLTFDYLHRASEPAAILLLLYWALAIPGYGQELAASARTYPGVRNLLLRLAEPLGAIEETDELSKAEDFTQEIIRPGSKLSGVSIVFRGVTIRAAGRTILEDANLQIPPGQKVAIVGPSGAGKSSFVGLLLGWHRAAEGIVYVDGTPLRGERLKRLRTETAWIDPGVQLWNRSMFDNLAYGAIGEARMARVLDDADLVGLLERLPEGLQTELGEGGALVSGGEGQRVRLGRAMMRPESRLVILDEPFRGLDREKRVLLLARARELWRGATVLCVTHDVGETLGFDRVVVIDNGRIAEAGTPADLQARPGSRYAAMLAAEEEVRRGMWGDPSFRRATMRRGELTVEEARARGTS